MFCFNVLKASRYIYILGRAPFCGALKLSSLAGALFSYVPLKEWFVLFVKYYAGIYQRCILLSHCCSGCILKFLAIEVHFFVIKSWFFPHFKAILNPKSIRENSHSMILNFVLSANVFATFLITTKFGWFLLIISCFSLFLFLSN